MLPILKETAIFMLAAQLILHFVPGKKYTGYGKMVVALLVLSQLALPVLSLGDKDILSYFQERLETQENDSALFHKKLENLEESQNSLLEDGWVKSVEELVVADAARAGIMVSAVADEGEKLVIRVVKEDGAEAVGGSTGSDSAAAAEDGTGSGGAASGGVKIEKIGRIGDGWQADVAGSAGKGSLRPDLAGLFAADLGMAEQEVEVIEVGQD